MSEQRTGVKVNAAAIETTRVIVTIQPIVPNNTPAIPSIIVKGKNTARVVSVEAIIDTPTSLVAKIAACLTREPRSTWLVIFSNTTIALSTTIPIEIEIEDIDTTLSVESATIRYINDESIEIGMVSTMINIARQRPSINITTNITTMKVMRIVSINEDAVSMMLSDISIYGSIVTSEGRVLRNSTNFSFTLREISTALASVCFWMIIIPLRVPLLRDS